MSDFNTKTEVENEEFWKWRLEEADKIGKLHYSVFNVNPVGWGQIERMHKKIIAELIKPEDKVLDAGCGYGRLSDWFKNYTGVDLSPDLIKRANELYPDGNFMVGNLHDLPFADKEFDWAICISIKGMIIGQSSLESWLKIEEELKRVAKRILILEYNPRYEYEVIK